MNKITLGILAHVDAGKTTLSEAILYSTGKLKELGRVDKKNSFLDTNELERERGITIFSKQARFNIGEIEYTLIDTPGHVDLAPEMERTLQVLDYAILLISASDMIQGHTITLWNKLKQYNIPTFIFINKMDQPDTDRKKIISEIKTKLSEDIIDFNDNNLDEKVYEEIAVSSKSEEVFNAYLDDEIIDNDTICDLIAQGYIIPCYFGSALKLDGIDSFIQGINRFVVCKEYPDEFAGKIYKISRDANGNRLSHIKITGGSIKVRDIIYEEKKVTQIRKYSGEKYECVDVAYAGEICCILGLDNTYAGQGVGFENDNNMKLITPVVSYELILPKEISARKVYGDIKRLEEEIPEISVSWNDKYEKIYLKFMGNVHIEVVSKLIKDILNIEPEFDMGQIIYKETITDKVIGVGHFEPLRHYAEVHLLLEPLMPGEGIVVESNCSEDILDRNWQRLIMSHLNNKKHTGVLTGSALTDVKITVINGKAHVKHTEGGDFKQATYRALRQGLMQAHSKLLEPYYNFEIQIPTDMVGKVMTDMEGMFCKISAPIIENEKAYIKGFGPVKTLREYQSKIDSFTKGKGNINLDFCGYYDCHNEKEVLENTFYNPEEDGQNPSSSVFCSHGSGIIVPWNEVSKYQHVFDDEYVEKNSLLKENCGISKEKFDYSIDLEEIDQIINKTFSSNANSHKKPYKIRKTVDLVGKTSGGNYRLKKGVKHIIDGYNVIFAWDELNELAKENIDSAKDKLIYYISDYCGIINEEVIVVFDGYKVKGNKGSHEIKDNIIVVHTKEGETADNYIEKYVNNNAKNYRIYVYSSDGMIQQISRGIGAYIRSSRELKDIYNEAKENIREKYNLN